MTLDEDTRGELCHDLVEHSRSYLAALSVIYKHAIECDLPPRVAEEYVLMVLRTMEVEP